MNAQGRGLVFGAILGSFMIFLCLCTVYFRGFLAKSLRVHTYISLIDSDNLQTIK